MDRLKKKVKQKTSSSARGGMIQVEPSELRFPFLPNAMLSASFSIKVVNVTDNYVVFVTRPMGADVARYTTYPDGGILPPRSTQEFLVRRTTKKSVAQSIECDDKYIECGDKYILCSTIVSESFSNSKYASDLDKFYHDHGDQIWHRIKLGVVLYPTYQQDSPDGMPHTELSLPAPEELIQVQPSEIHFPFLPNVMLSASSLIKVLNITDNYVVLVSRTPVANVAEYGTRRNAGILPPRSTQEFLVRRIVKKSVVQSIKCDDKYLLFSTTVSKSFINSEHCVDLNKFFDKQSGQIWHIRELAVVLEPAYREGSPDGMPHTEELIQVIPHELRFPFVPDESISVTSLIKVVNMTDDYIAFHPRYNVANMAEYTMTPTGGILRPWSTQDIVVTRKSRKGVLQSIKCNDTNFLYSTVVSEDFQSDDLGKFYDTEVGVIWHKLELGVLLEEDTQLQPSEFLTHNETESTLDPMSLQHLKDITNNFSNERILGRGGFGVVYKGVLGNGKMVAVKKLVQSMPSSQQQFENEVNLLMKLKHPNIVRLVGYCYETQHLRGHHEGKIVFAWNTECLLCLEFLLKGSLDKYISDASSGLDWPTRLKIIEGIFYGLQYLHEQSDGPIIHLDLKPANVLLDKNMIPKLTDFGLSRLFDQKQTIHTAINSGTLGYMPPEYLRGIITPMSDIFALGVTIMEVITGHREYPYDIRTSSTEFIEHELQKWRNVLQKQQGYTSLEIDCQQITRCIQIGLICVNPERTKRPTMKKIIDMLQGSKSMDWYISNEVMSRA
uniref:Protein kinase domain-containing protein n=1 Tax=Aegilops tauschii subsp. strangulata TaxID=200361 RepID=A0A453MJ46_AEGTS